MNLDVAGADTPPCRRAGDERVDPSVTLEHPVHPVSDRRPIGDVNP